MESALFSNICIPDFMALHFLPLGIFIAGSYKWNEARTSVMGCTFLGRSGRGQSMG